MKKVTAQHAIYSLWGVDSCWDNDLLMSTMREAIEACGATFLKEQYHLFEPQGLSYAALLSESHSSLHSYPEHKFLFIDCFTCGDMSHSKFADVIKSRLKPSKMECKFMDRSTTFKNIN